MRRYLAAFAIAGALVAASAAHAHDDAPPEKNIRFVETGTHVSLTPQRTGMEIYCAHGNRLALRLTGDDGKEDVYISYARCGSAFE